MKHEEHWAKLSETGDFFANAFLEDRLLQRLTFTNIVLEEN